MSKCWNALRGPASLLATVLALSLLPGCHSLKFNNSPTSDKAEAKPDGGPPSLPSSHSASHRMYSYPISTCRTISRCSRNWLECADQIYKELLLPPGNAVVQVYLFEDHAHYQRFMQSRYPELPERRAFFVAQPRSIGGAEDLLVYTFWGERIQQDLRQELTHALLHSVIRDVPFGSMKFGRVLRLPADRKALTPRHLASLRRGPLGPYKPDLTRLEGLTEVKQMAPRNTANHGRGSV